MTTIDLTICSVEFGSPAYFRTLELRNEVLRKPLGLQFNPSHLEKECDDIHLAGRTSDGEIICCLVLTPFGNGTVKMRQVATSEKFQRMGLGRKLAMASEEKARELGFCRIVLHARAGAVEFYEKMKYTVEGEEFIEVGIPHRKMSKDIIS